MRILVTGGLGFIGSNYAQHCLSRGDRVAVLDNRSSGKSCEINLNRLSEIGEDRFSFVDGNVALEEHIIDAINSIGGKADIVIHSAAQTSVSRSLDDPGLDFSSNALGTFVLFETLRHYCPGARVVCLASNRIYNTLNRMTEISGSRYKWLGHRVGPAEDIPFHTDALDPHGASKIAGFYYSRCYASAYNMPIVTCVPSGVYGPYQYSRSEDGWLGWFAICTAIDLPITIYGDGLQTFDMLHVGDLCSALDVIVDNAEKYKGELFNVGGGPRNVISFMEALSLISSEFSTSPRLKYHGWRSHDYKIYISNIERMVGLGWVPSKDLRYGIKELCVWVQSEKDVFNKLYK